MVQDVDHSRFDRRPPKPSLTGRCKVGPGGQPVPPLYLAYLCLVAQPENEVAPPVFVTRGDAL